MSDCSGYTQAAERKTLAVVVNGAAGSGKDTFVEFVMGHLKRHGLSSSNHSSVGLVKEAALILGWDGVKDERGRQFLCDLKDYSTKMYDGPMKYMSGLIDRLQHDVMFFHIREPAEIARFLKSREMSCSVIVHRAGISRPGNHADQNIEDFPYTHEIFNHYSLAELKSAAAEIAGVLAYRHAQWRGWLTPTTRTNTHQP